MTLDCMLKSFKRVPDEQGVKMKPQVLQIFCEIDWLALYLDWLEEVSMLSP